MSEGSEMFASPLGEIQSSRYFLSESQRIARTGSYVLDVVRGEWKSNAILDAIFGIDDSYVRSVEGWLKLVHPEDLGLCETHLARVLAGEIPFDLEYRIVRASDGQARWVRGVGEVYRDAQGRAVHMIGVIRDIHEQRTAVLELRRSQEELLSLFEHTPVATCLLDEQSRLLRLNKAFRDYLDNHDCIQDAQPGVLISCIHAAKTGPSCGRTGSCAQCVLRNAIASCLRTGQPVERARMEARVQRQGRTVESILLISVTRITLQGQTRLLFSFEDVTEMERLEHQLIQSHKLEAITQLAGGVAHDFNNILAGILLQSQNLLNELPPGPELLQAIQEIRDGARRAASLTSQLLHFSQRSTRHPEDIDLNVLLDSLQRPLLGIAAGRCTLQVTPHNGALPVEADGGMIGQVILNLVANACDASPQGGLVRLELGSREIGGEAAEQRRVPAGTYALIRVCDQGPGMDEATKLRIFDPFFTTKPIGKGTGLGLSAVHGIVLQHGGWIDVESAPGQGACLIVHLPRRRAAAAPEVPPEPAPEQTPGTVLLVEDDRNLAAVLNEYLSKQGFRVLEAHEGRGALALWAEHRESIDLLFTDMVMPGSISGLDLLREIRNEGRRLPAVVFTGYSRELLKNIHDLDDDTVVLNKPSDPHAIGRAVRSALTASRKEKEETNGSHSGG